MKRTTLNCPRCAGSFNVKESERVTRCDTCGTKLYVDLGDHIPRYFIKPKTGIKEAKTIVRKAIASHGISSKTSTQLRWRGAKLCFVPYYEMTGRRLGAFTAMEKKSQYTPLAKIERLEPNTQIVMGDIMRSAPAVELIDWGLERINIEKARQTEHLHSFDRKKFGSHTTVFNPEVSLDVFTAHVFKVMQVAMGGDNTVIEEKEAKIVFYPVYRARYAHKHKLYQATVDGVEGKVMEARAPHLGGGRINMLLISLALVALPISKLARFAAQEIVKNGPDGVIAAAIGMTLHPVTFTIMLLLTTIALTLLTFGWKHFRYAGEMVITPDGATVEYTTTPATTWIDKLLTLFLKIIEAMGKSAAQAQKRNPWI